MTALIQPARNLLNSNPNPLVTVSTGINPAQTTSSSTVISTTQNPVTALIQPARNLLNSNPNPLATVSTHNCTSSSLSLDKIISSPRDPTCFCLRNNSMGILVGNRRRINVYDTNGVLQNIHSFSISGFPLLKIAFTSDEKLIVLTKRYNDRIAYYVEVYSGIGMILIKFLYFYLKF